MLKQVEGQTKDHMNKRILLFLLGQFAYAALASSTSTNAWYNAFFSKEDNNDFAKHLIRPGAPIPNSNAKSGWKMIQRLDSPDTFDFSEYQRLDSNATYRAICIGDKVAFCEVKFTKPHAITTTGNTRKGMSLLQGIESKVSEDGIVCLVEHNQTGPTIRLFNIKDAQRRLPCSYFSLEGRSLGMLRQEEDIIRTITENDFDTGNIITQGATLLCNPLIGLALHFARWAENDMQKQIRTQFHQGVLSHIQRHYTKEDLDKVGGYDFLLSKLKEKLGTPSSSRRSKIYVHKRSDEWVLKKNDLHATLSQDDTETCILTVSSITLEKPAAQTTNHSTSKTSINNVDLGF